MAEKLKETQLDRIERKINENSRSSNKQWAQSLGLGIIVASAGLVSQNVWLGAGLFIAGYLLMVLPVNFLRKY